MTHDEQRIRELHDAFERDTKARDLDRIMNQYADDLVAFDAVGALQFKGRDEYRAHWQRCFEFCQGEGFFETHELHVTASGDMAYSRMLNPLRRAQCRGPDADCLDARHPGLGQARR